MWSYTRPCKCAALQVSEIALAAFFRGCGPIVDVRLCADEQSLDGRFAFIEFNYESSVKKVSGGLCYTYIQGACGLMMVRCLSIV